MVQRYQQPEDTSSSDAHIVRTPTGDARMDADRKEATWKEPNQRQTGHRKPGQPTDQEENTATSPQ